MEFVDKKKEKEFSTKETFKSTTEETPLLGDAQQTTSQHELDEHKKKEEERLEKEKQEKERIEREQRELEEKRKEMERLAEEARIKAEKEE